MAKTVNAVSTDNDRANWLNCTDTLGNLLLQLHSISVSMQAATVGRKQSAAGVISG
jgi:hypothetical protein